MGGVGGKCAGGEVGRDESADLGVVRGSEDVGTELALVACEGFADREEGEGVHVGTETWGAEEGAR